MRSTTNKNPLFCRLSRSISVTCAVSVCLSLTQLTAQSGPSTIAVTAGQDLAAIVARSPSNTTFSLAAGVYRMAAVQPKDGDHFLGQSGTILNGSKILHFVKDGNLWSATEPVATSDPKFCLASHPRCFLLSDLFIDNQIRQPATDLDSLDNRSWYYDASQQKIFLNQDPAGRTVELSKAPAAFSGNGTGVEINNLTVEKYASPPQRGAVGGGGTYAAPAGWKLSHLNVQWNHGGGVHVGSGSLVDGCNIHDNGQSGLGGSGNDILVTNNTIDANNFAGYRVDWEAGAVKFARTDRLVLRSNLVRNNLGNGLWTDIDNIHVLMEKNTILDNMGEGIRHEIGYDAVIRNNFLRGNLNGIVIALSENVQVYGNVIEVPPNGDFGFRFDLGHRQNAEGRSYQLRNVAFHDNIISYLGSKGRSGLIGAAFAASMISVDNNEYHAADGNHANRWRWDNRSLSVNELGQFNLETHAKTLGPGKQLPDPTR